jgi:alkylated DNA nucleotide flippase Atl1
MTETRCVHGMDGRFCAICNRRSRGGPRGSDRSISLTEVLRFLNDARTRATYGAVAGVLGMPPRSMGAMLRNRRAEASWVVNGVTGLPTDYEQSDWHPDLLASSEVIRTDTELMLRMALWRAHTK